MRFPTLQVPNEIRKAMQLTNMLRQDKGLQKDSLSVKSQAIPPSRASTALELGCRGTRVPFSPLFGGEPLGPTGESLWAEAQAGNLETVKFLVSRGADVNDGGGTPLWKAVYGGHVEVVKFLLDSGANPDGGGEAYFFKGRLVALAAEHNRLDILDLLIAAGASLTSQRDVADMLYGAAKNGHLEAVRKLIKAGVDVNFNDGVALLKAAQTGHLEVVKEIVKAGADVNMRGGWIVDAAGRAGQTEVMKVLIEAGAAKEHLDSALHEASGNGRFKTMKLLLDNGADPNYAGTLKAAATSGNLEIVKSLLDAGAEITYEKRTGYPLHFAASKGHIDVVALLAEHGGDINGRLTEDTWMDFIIGSDFYGNGWTVMHVIARFGYPFVKELLDLGAEINVKDASGNTPLQVAVIYKKLKMAKEFLRFCIDALHVNSEGNTALALAMKLTQENTTFTTEQQRLMAAIEETFPDGLASTPDNTEGYEALAEEFSALFNNSSALKKRLRYISFDESDISVAIYYIFLEESIRELPKTIEDAFCQPSLQKEHKVSIGMEYLAKCECVLGEGPTMTYTPVLEEDKCQGATSGQSEKPTQDPQHPHHRLRNSFVLSQVLICSHINAFFYLLHLKQISVVDIYTSAKVFIITENLVIVIHDLLNLFRL
ncbi:putative ankyrin repeat protein RF_0381 [Macrobrachium rosenbergii]|uniref:putative ankyrin repeat protein RF_0381 n=1 Tax=Macrobrachium rosenbergii TaxID=79674 RepID=UPI0034D6F206